MKRLTVDSIDHCYVLEEERLAELHSSSTSIQLEPGTYIVRIERGAFSYHPENNGQFTPEPWVLLWIHGGQVVNKKTNVKVGATWSSLNGYDDTLTIDVIERTTLCGLFFDPHQAGSSGQVVLSILKDQ